jgi:hypothetical protein
VHYPRLKKSEYEALKKTLDKEYFYNFYLNNCNDYVCKEFRINLSTLYSLIKDLEIALTKEQKRHRNKISGEQKCLEAFGAANPFSTKAVQDKIKEVNLTKYGVENVFAAEEIKEKIKHTSLSRYGVEYTSQSQEVKQKIKDTCLEKYGVDNYAKTDECQEKIRQTNLVRYGVEASAQDPSVRAKAKQTCLERYGVESTMCLPEVQAKSRQTSLARYGATHYSKTFEFHNRIRKRYIFKDEAFDSLPELAVWVYCVDHNISIKRNPCRLEYAYNDKVHQYFPDFEIAGKLVEIKGDHFFKKDGTMQNPFDSSQDALYEAKHQCGIQNGVQFWRKADYKKYEKYFTENYDIADYVFKKNDEVN